MPQQLRNEDLVGCVWYALRILGTFWHQACKVNRNLFPFGKERQTEFVPIEEELEPNNIFREQWKTPDGWFSRWNKQKSFDNDVQMGLPCPV